MKNEFISMIERGLRKMNELSFDMELIEETDKETLDKFKMFIHLKYSDVLAALYFLAENAQKIEEEEPWRELTLYKIANNFRSIVLLIAYDAYKEIGSHKKG